MKFIGLYIAKFIRIVITDKDSVNILSFHFKIDRVFCKAYDTGLQNIKVTVAAKVSLNCLATEATDFLMKYYIMICWVFWGFFFLIKCCYQDSCSCKGTKFWFNIDIKIRTAVSILFLRGSSSKRPKLHLL